MDQPSLQFYNQILLWHTVLILVRCCPSAHGWVIAAEVLLCKALEGNCTEQPRWQRPHWLLLVARIIATRCTVLSFLPILVISQQTTKVYYSTCPRRRITAWQEAWIHFLCPLPVLGDTHTFCWDQPSAGCSCSSCSFELNFFCCFEPLPPQKSDQMSLSAPAGLAPEDTAISPVYLHQDAWPRCWSRLSRLPWAWTLFQHRLSP